MAKHDKHGGLCMTCANSATCTLPTSLGRPVFHCEMFTVGEPPGVEAASPQQAAGPQEAPDTAMGVCCTCDDRQTCVFPRSRRGVLYCEEYR